MWDLLSSIQIFLVFGSFLNSGGLNKEHMISEPIQNQRFWCSDLGFFGIRMIKIIAIVPTIQKMNQVIGIQNGDLFIWVGMVKLFGFGMSFEIIIIQHLNNLQPFKIQMSSVFEPPLYSYKTPNKKWTKTCKLNGLIHNSNGQTNHLTVTIWITDLSGDLKSWLTWILNGQKEVGL